MNWVNPAYTWDTYRLVFFCVGGSDIIEASTGLFSFFWGRADVQQSMLIQLHSLFVCFLLGCLFVCFIVCFWGGLMFNSACWSSRIVVIDKINDILCFPHHEWPYCEYIVQICEKIASSISKNITFYHPLFPSRTNTYKWLRLKPIQKAFTVYFG